MTEAIEVIETKKFELRAPVAKDVFLMSRIIAKIGVNNFVKCFNTDEVKQAIADFKKEDKKEDQLNVVGVAVALDIANVLFEHLPACETELYNFLSALSGLKVKAIQDLPMSDFLEMIIEVVSKPEFKDFFKVASKLFK